MGLGDRVEPKEGDREYLELAAEMVMAVIPDNHGFIIFTFGSSSSGEGENTLFYTSNCKRDDCIKLVKEWLFAQGEKGAWMEHIK